MTTSLKFPSPWLDEHQFLECLIQIVCGTYVPEELADAEKAEHETSEKPHHNHKDDSGGSDADRDKEKQASFSECVAALLAHLALSEVEEVARTLLTLGTPALLVELFFQHPNNNFLHAHVYTLLKHALTNRVFRNQYQRHLVEECGLLARLMDAWEAARAGPGPRPGYMGHVVLSLARLARALAQPDAAPLPPDLAPRWEAFRDHELRPLLQQHDTPLGGYHPSENIYEVEIMADTLAANYDMCRDMASNLESPDFIADGLGIDDADNMRAAKSNFLELARQRFDDDMWDSPGEAEDEAEAEAEPAVAVQDLLDQHSPWESAGGGGGGAGEGWAQFDEFAPHDQDFAPFWAYAAPIDPELEAGMRSLRLEAAEARRLDDASSVELANNLLTAMSAMSPDAIANIVSIPCFLFMFQELCSTARRCGSGHLSFDPYNQRAKYYESECKSL
ncbi:hypothetical protein B5X24_HaOG201770 [Helicoverpa armigera]|nr:hypothetical protein B5X24_HaOG201770 [Helicoverpa armigera]